MNNKAQMITIFFSLFLILAIITILGIESANLLSNENINSLLQQYNIPKLEYSYMLYSIVGTSNLSASNLSTLLINNTIIKSYKNTLINLNISINNANDSYLNTYPDPYVIFIEEGLKTGESWSVTYGGKTNTSTSSIITFYNDSIYNVFKEYSYSLPAGSEKQIPGTNCYYVNGPTPTNGKAGQGSIILIVFSNQTYCKTTFIENGLPSGTKWNVTYNGLLNSSTTNTITFLAPFLGFPNQTLTIHNSQSIATPAPFQQMVNLTINSSNSKFINMTGKYAFQNVEFLNTTTGNVIDSWLESYNVNNGKGYAIYWIKLPNGIPAGSTINDVEVVYYPANTNLFNGNTIGEAPTLSSSYAEYDDGANIFDYYWNFAGTTLPSGWEEYFVGGTADAAVVVDNGVALESHSSDDEAFIYYPGLSSTNYVLDIFSPGGPKVIGWLNSGSPSGDALFTGTSSYLLEDGYSGYAVAGQTGGITLEDSSGVSYVTNPMKLYSNTEYSFYWVDGSQRFAYNYNNGVITGSNTDVSTTSDNSIYLGGDWSSSGYSNINVNYTEVDLRAEPPNGVMPSVSVSSVNNIGYPFSVSVPPKTTSNGCTISYAASPSSGFAPSGYTEYVDYTETAICAFNNMAITNSQSIATPAPFQQMVNLTINSSNSKFINMTGKYAFQNVEFLNTTTGNVIDSWLESYNVNNGKGYAIYWIKLPNGIPAGSTINDVEVVYSFNNTNLLNKNSVGEAPSLSPTYGEYDDGNNVFNYYTNFTGPSLPSGWAAYYINNGATYSVDDGITLTPSYTSGHPSGTLEQVLVYLTTSDSTNEIFDAYVPPAAAGGACTLLGWTTGSPSTDGAIGSTSTYSIGYGYSGFACSGQTGGIFEDGTSIASPMSKESPIIANFYWVDGKQIFWQNYTNEISASNTGYSTGSTNSIFLGGDWETSSYNEPMTYQWARLRAYPPNGVMPSVSIDYIS